MSQARHGDTVKIHYAGRLDGGTTFDTGVGEESFTLDAGHPLAGQDPTFDVALVSLA